MPQKEVSALVTGIASVSIVGTASGQLVRGITNDSRQIQHGYLYAALRGDHVDGHSFIGDAVESGAAAILCSDVPRDKEPGVVYLQADAPRLALSEISDAFYDHPSRRLDVVGITGTDGKTSTVYFTYQLLKAMGAGVGFLSTAAVELTGKVEHNRLHQSTPEAPEVHRILDELAANGKQIALIESTSHGLSAKSCRLAHITYRGAVLTNLTHEHLEYHGTFAQYRHDKANLFRALGTYGYATVPGFDAIAAEDWSRQSENISQPVVTLKQIDRLSPFGVANRDDPAFEYFVAQTDQPVLSYSLRDAKATVQARKIELDITGTRFFVESDGDLVPVRVAVPGLFNVENVLAAMLTTAALTGASITELSGAADGLESVHGRMEVVCREPFAVVVDYAHTPGSFESILPFFREHTSGRLIVLFGSAGERDVGKRPIQGRLASSYADIIVLTDEDPRSEDRMAILEEIASGITSHRRGEELYLIANRRDAIKTAIGLARPGDTLLLLGKGHEASIIGRCGPEEWDEIAVATEELKRAGIS